MKISKLAVVVDSHTGGEPTRILIGGGFLNIPGENIHQKRAWFIQNQDFFRTFLMNEPRGHQDMYGAIIIPPTMNDADIGVFFIDSHRYADMCGHGTIGVVTTVIQLGLVKVEPPDYKLTLETPAGKVFTRSHVENGEVKSVTFKNIPSFFYSSEKITVKEIGDIPLDIAYGGNYFALVKSQDLNIEIIPEEIVKIKRLGRSILKEANNQIKVIDPNTKENRKIDLIQIYNEATYPPRNVTLGPVKVDRSPCGTGTCAKMALLNAKGMLGIQEEYRYRGILGTEFQGRIIEKTVIKGYKEAIIPEVTGSAHITGIQQLIATENDPFKWGFKL
jgi:proline racemase/trans-L-3-hydroxyproline dehydratase